MLQFAQEHLAAGKVRMKRVLNAGTMKVPKTQTALSELESLHNVSRTAQDAKSRGVRRRMLLLCDVDDEDSVRG